MKYFAYGSNLAHAQMKIRCPSSRFFDVALIKDYKVVFDGYSPRWGSAVANIVPSEGEEAWGCIYDISAIDLEELDTYEGHGARYQRVTATAILEDKTTLSCYVYLRPPQKPGRPSKDYLDTLYRGIKDCKLTMKVRYTF